MAWFSRRFFRFSVTAMLVLCLSACTGGFAIVGILAAIAIPAYQDYTIRAQVHEGLNLSGGMKVQMAEAYLDTGDFPQGISVVDGKYTQSVEIIDHNVVITYGNDANSLIAGRSLVLTPYVDENRSHLYWVCGYAEPEADMVSLVDPLDTDLDPKYLPQSCK